MAHVFGQRHKKQNKAWHLTKLILSFYYQKSKKQKTKKQNKTYQKKKQNKRRRKKGKKKTKKQRRKRKGLRPPVSCDGNSGYLVSISTSIFGLSFFFFFLTNRFPFSGRNTPIFCQYDPNQPGSARICQGEKKKKPQTRHRHTGSCVGLRCGTLPTASVLPRWDSGWRPTGCITYHSKKKKKKVCGCVQCVYSFQVTMKLSTRTPTSKWALTFSPSFVFFSNEISINKSI